MNFYAPLNSLSFGFVGYNLLNEFFKTQENVNVFPVGGQVDLTSFSAATEEFKEFLKKSVFEAPDKFSRADKTLSLWHIQNSETSIGKNSNLLTFHELDNLTKTEINILKNQDCVFVTSKYSQRIFKDFGINSVYVPLGFDSAHFQKVDKKYFQDDRVIISVFGKCEPSRKRTAKVIQALQKKFGNDKRFAIHLSIYNTFLNPEQNAGMLNQILGGQKPYNFNILPYTKTLKEFNDILGVTNIVVDCGTESWSIPSFSAIALGKYGVLSNYGAIPDWAENTGSEMVNSSGKIPVYDQMFFHEGGRFNQGNIFDFNEDEMIAGVEKSIEKFRLNPVNQKGLELQKKYPWSESARIILENLK